VGGDIGLVHATAFTDDRQVMVFIQRFLERSGITSHLLSPADVDWRGGVAYAGGRPLPALLRFFPVEWLPNLPGRTWKAFFENTTTLQVNPGRAALSQSKRFPIIWPYLHSEVSVWQELLPPTQPWQENLGDDWVCKPAFGRVGDGIGLCGVTSDSDWKLIRKARRRRPEEWIAQRRFCPIACETPAGPLYPCISVYVIDGRAAGIYGRVARRPLIDYLAQDVAVLVAGAAQEERKEQFALLSL
jgi:glutathionylspermidine synthase